VLIASISSNGNSKTSSANGYTEQDRSSIQVSPPKPRRYN
jgi:hypothetical protein